MTLATYRVTTTLGIITVLAYSLAEAIKTGLELTGPGSKILSCLREGEW